jgi:hypothetical protein
VRDQRKAKLTNIESVEGGCDKIQSGRVVVRVAREAAREEGNFIETLEARHVSSITTTTCGCSYQLKFSSRFMIPTGPVPALAVLVVKLEPITTQG